MAHPELSGCAIQLSALRHSVDIPPLSGIGTLPYLSCREKLMEKGHHMICLKLKRFTCAHTETF